MRKREKITHKFRFHKFVYADHQPLEKLLGDQKALSNVVSIRFHWHILFLQNFNCKIKYRPGTKQKNVCRCFIASPTIKIRVLAI